MNDKLNIKQTHFQEHSCISNIPLALLLFSIFLFNVAYAQQESPVDKPLIFGTELDYPPYSYQDLNGQPIGYNVDMAKAVAQVTGLTISVKIAPWNQIRHEVETGEIDAVVGMYYSVQRDSLVDFSMPMTLIHHAIFCRENMPHVQSEKQLSNARVMVMRGDIMHDYLLQKKITENPILVGTQGDMIKRLSLGQGDYALMAKLPGLYWLKEYDIDNVRIEPLPMTPSQYCFAVTEGNHDLISRISEGLAILQETGRAREIYDKWLGTLERHYDNIKDIRTVKIGVLAKRGQKKCWQKWGLTADYLTEHIPGHQFVLVPLSFEDVFLSTQAGDVDFILANPSCYVQLETLYNVRRLVTLNNKGLDRSYSSFAGVIFCRADRSDIRQLKDLRRKTFMAVDENSFGGWQMAWYELKKYDIIPQKDFKSLSFGNTHDAVVHAVLDGEVDAGTVRSDTLERMANEGLINLQDVYVINERTQEDELSYRHSTPLYPEWPMAALKHVDPILVNQVASSLLDMPADSAAARASDSAGWSIPLNYHDVEDCLRELKIGPYKNFGDIPFKDVIVKYWPWLTTILLLMALLSIAAMLLARIGYQLKQSVDEKEREIKVRRSIEDTLHQAHDNLKTILMNAPFGVVVVGKDRRIRWVNHQMCRLTEMSADMLEGKPCRDNLCPQGQYHCPFYDLNDKMVNTEKILRTCHGQEIPILKSVTEIHINDEDVLLETFVDISKQKAQEQHLQQTLKEAENLNCVLEEQTVLANHMAAEAAMANSAKSEFLANMSHEIRTPLNAIIGFSDILGDSELSNEQQENLSIIRRAGENLLNLINDILDFSKIEAGKMQVELIECRLAVLLNGIESMMRPKADNKNITFDIITSSDLPYTIISDPSRLNQCLLNLVNNAVKFTNAGHVHLDVSLCYVEEEPYIRFDIEDTGVGIDPEQQTRIFDSFTQADGSTTRIFGGTGLGLSITKQLSLLLDGQLSVTSEVGKGSTFTLIIPARVEIDKNTKFDRYSEMEKPAPHTLDVTFNGRILVAEDVETNRDLVAMVLRSLGLNAELVENGKLALEQVLANEYDLILMDVQMPIMDGLETTRQLRRRNYSIPIVALTAHALKDDRQRCIQAGCDDYLTKPLRRRELIECLKRFIPFTYNNESSSDMPESTPPIESSSAQDPKPDEPQKDSTPEKIQEDIIDFRALMNLIDGDEELLQNLMDACLETYPQRLADLEKAVNQGNLEDAAFVAHSVKSSAANLHAIQIYPIAAEMEKQAKNNQDEKLSQLMADLQDNFQKLRTFLQEQDWLEIARRAHREVTNSAV